MRPRTIIARKPRPRSTESYEADPARNERILFFLTLGALIAGILSYTLYLLIWG